MRRAMIVIAAGALALALAAAAIAVTTGGGISNTTASFTAAPVGQLESKTCTATDGTYVGTRGRYFGKITFTDPNSDLNGNVTIQAHSIQKTGGPGFIEGWFRIGAGDDHHGYGRIVATLDGSGNVDGFVHTFLGGRSAVLAGHLGGTFKTDTGFAGTIGNGGTSTQAVIVSHPCHDAKPGEPKPGTPGAGGPKHEHPSGIVFLRGKVTAVDPNRSITVDSNGSAAPAPQTCVVKDGKSPSLAGVTTDTEVWAVCGQFDGSLTLLKLWKLPPHPTSVTAPATT